MEGYGIDDIDTTSGPNQLLVPGDFPFTGRNAQLVSFAELLPSAPTHLFIAFLTPVSWHREVRPFSSCQHFLSEATLVVSQVGPHKIIDLSAPIPVN